jgi:hypothetical protein
MRKILSLFLICFCTVGVLAQKKKTVSKTSEKATESILTPKKELEAAIAKSKQSEKIRVVAEVSLGSNEVVSIFEFSSPDRFHLFEKVSGKVVKEAIEIEKQRYQKKGEQWIKTRLDYVPLRNQFADIFRIKFISNRDDAIKIKNVKVILLGEETLNEKKYRKYGYTIIYNYSEFNESGIVWVSENAGLLERIETESAGLFGRTKSIWTYIYDKEIKIEPPSDFIEKDWVD